MDYKVLGFKIDIAAGKVSLPSDAIPLNMDYVGEGQSTIVIQCLIPVKEVPAKEKKSGKGKQ